MRRCKGLWWTATVPYKDFGQVKVTTNETHINGLECLLYTQKHLIKHCNMYVSHNT